MTTNPTVKFSGQDLNASVPHDYGNRWCQEDHEGWSRLSIGPSRDHIDLMLKLAAVMPPPYGLLWVLVLPTTGREPGRYQSPLIESHDHLSTILSRYRAFFEGDGRHHLWVVSPESGTQLIYDNHNLIYAYGAAKPFAAVLKESGLCEGQIEVPIPHSHGYDARNADVEEQFFGECDWQYFPLVTEHDDP